MTLPPVQPSPRQSLITLRIIWAALLLGQVLFLVVVLSLIRQPGEPLDGQVRQIIFVASLGMLIAFVPLGYLVRGRAYEAGRQQDGTVSAASYATGNIILLALCEAPSMMAIVGILLSRETMPFVLVTILAIAVQTINFPTGGPMRAD
jgi:hypothetical protein